jgi:hypothetical protein
MTAPNCPGSGQPPLVTSENAVVGGVVVATRGTCPVCGVELKLIKPRSRRPVVRKHGSKAR